MDKKIRNLIIKKIFTTLEEKKISQKELAKTLNISSSTVSAWATGRNTPNLDKIFQICNILNISIDVFNINKENSEFYKKFNILTEKEKQLILMIINKLIIDNN